MNGWMAMTSQSSLLPEYAAQADDDDCPKGKAKPDEEANHSKTNLQLMHGGGSERMDPKGESTIIITTTIQAIASQANLTTTQDSLLALFTSARA